MPLDSSRIWRKLADWLDQPPGKVKSGFEPSVSTEVSPTAEVREVLAVVKASNISKDISTAPGVLWTVPEKTMWRIHTLYKETTVGAVGLQVRSRDGATYCRLAIVATAAQSVPYGSAVGPGFTIECDQGNVADSNVAFQILYTAYPSSQEQSLV